MSYIMYIDLDGELGVQNIDGSGGKICEIEYPEDVVKEYSYGMEVFDGHDIEDTAYVSYYQ